MTKYIGRRQGHEQVFLSSLYGVLGLPNYLEGAFLISGKLCLPQNEESKNAISQFFVFSCIYRQMPSYKDFIKHAVEHTGRHQIGTYIIGI